MRLRKSPYKHTEPFEISLTPEQRKEIEKQKENLTPAAQKIRDMAERAELKAIRRKFKQPEIENRRPRRIYY